MSQGDTPHGGPDGPEREPDDDESLSSWLGGKAPFSDVEPPPDLLHGVQKRIRERSRGKFYQDGWSRSGAPASTFALR